MVTSYKLPYQNMLIYKFLRSQIPTKLHLLPNQENYSATIIFLSSNIFFYLLLGDPGILVSRSQYLTMWILFNLSYLKSFLWKGTHHLVPSSNSSKRPLTDITPMVEQVFMTLQKWKSFHIAERGWHSFYPWKKKGLQVDVHGHTVPSQSIESLKWVIPRRAGKIWGLTV